MKLEIEGSRSLYLNQLVTNFTTLYVDLVTQQNSIFLMTLVHLLSALWSMRRGRGRGARLLIRITYGLGAYYSLVRMDGYTCIVTATSVLC